MRNNKIDLLRFIGLAMIVFAHISPPTLLFQIRNFDVPLMVFISGVSFKLSYKPNKSYINYIWKRVKRLVFPPWIFLAFFFIISHFVFKNEIPMHSIVTSFIFLSGIGYVWIIGVFLLMSFIAPFLYSVEKRMGANSHFFIYIVLAFVFYEVFQQSTHQYFIANKYLKIIGRIIFYIIPYSIIYLLGIRILRFSKKSIAIISGFCFLVFAALGVCLYIREGYFVPTQIYKFPLSTYYVSYAMAISMLLWVVGDFIWLKLNEKLKVFVLFVSENSIWIYLWHIPFVFLINTWDANFILEYVLVLFLAILMVFIQVNFLEKVIITKLSNKKTIKNLRVLFKG
ncbi:acyltransferase [uncultured Algibacter sp.]|uniref:acyltransferase family protein n=1 Tax=uncultured Algibacter sp. TaxID=298659 RepID=UPI0032167AC8